MRTDLLNNVSTHPTTTVTTMIHTQRTSSYHHQQLAFEEQTATSKHGPMMKQQ